MIDRLLADAESALRDECAKPDPDVARVRELEAERDRLKGIGSVQPFKTLDEEPELMGFSQALEMAKLGDKIARVGWNGKGQFVVVMPALYLPPFNTQGTERKVNDRTAKWIGEDKPLDCQPYLALYNAQAQWQPGWVPSQGDLFAGDWIVVE